MRLTRRSFAASAAAVPLMVCRNAAEETPSSTTGEPAWRAGPRAPYAVQEIYPALQGDAIWVAGGFAPLAALGATQRVIVLDIASNAWREGPSLPTPSHHVQLASLNGDLYAIGGFLGGDNRRRWICTPRVLKLDGDAWIEGPPLPKPIAEGITLVNDGRIHLIGGRSPRGEANATWDDQTDVDDHFVLAASAAQWERAAPLPMARNSHGGAVIGELHVVSGRTVADGPTPAHHIYDPSADAWRAGPDFPEPRGGIAAAAWRGRIVAGGGETFDPGSVGDTLYEFADGAWRAFETMPTPRHGHGFVAAGDALYAIGGARRPSADGTMANVDVLG